MLATQIKTNMSFTHSHTCTEAHTLKRIELFWACRIAYACIFKGDSHLINMPERLHIRSDVDLCMIWIYWSFRPKGVLIKDWWHHYLHTKYIWKFYSGYIVWSHMTINSYRTLRPNIHSKSTQHNAIQFTIRKYFRLIGWKWKVCKRKDKKNIHSLR